MWPIKRSDPEVQQKWFTVNTRQELQRPEKAEFWAQKPQTARAGSSDAVVHFLEMQSNGYMETVCLRGKEREMNGNWHELVDQ